MTSPTPDPWKVGTGILDTTIYIGDETEKDPTRPIVIIGTMARGRGRRTRRGLPCVTDGAGRDGRACRPMPHGGVRNYRAKAPGRSTGILQTAIVKIHGARAAIVKARGGAP